MSCCSCANRGNSCSNGVRTWLERGLPAGHTRVNGKWVYPVLCGASSGPPSIFRSPLTVMRPPRVSIRLGWIGGWRMCPFQRPGWRLAITLCLLFGRFRPDPGTRPLAGGQAEGRRIAVLPASCNHRPVFRGHSKAERIDAEDSFAGALGSGDRNGGECRR